MPASTQASHQKVDICSPSPIHVPEQQALRHHPDKNPNNVEEATAKFKSATWCEWNMMEKHQLLVGIGKYISSYIYIFLFPYIYIYSMLILCIYETMGLSQHNLPQYPPNYHRLDIPNDKLSIFGGCSQYSIGVPLFWNNPHAYSRNFRCFGAVSCSKTVWFLLT